MRIHLIGGSFDEVRATASNGLWYVGDGASTAARHSAVKFASSSDQDRAVHPAESVVCSWELQLTWILQLDNQGYPGNPRQRGIR
jgi:hypothetical protein